jgi:hypothetical protein
MLLYALCMFIRRARAQDDSGVPVYAFGLCFAYAMLLMWGVNYPTYRELGAIDNAVNGRYLLPILPLIYMLASRYTVAVLRPRTQLIVSALIALVFVISDMPYFLQHADVCWFAGAPAEAQCMY